MLLEPITQPVWPVPGMRGAVVHLESHRLSISTTERSAEIQKTVVGLNQKKREHKTCFNQYMQVQTMTLLSKDLDLMIGKS